MNAFSGIKMSGKEVQQEKTGSPQGFQKLFSLWAHFDKESLAFRFSEKCHYPRAETEGCHYLRGLRCHLSDGECGWNSTLSENLCLEPQGWEGGDILFTWDIIEYWRPLDSTVRGKKHCRKKSVFPKWKGLKVHVKVRILEQRAMSPSTISSFYTFYKWGNQDPTRLCNTAQSALEED